MIYRPESQTVVGQQILMQGEWEEWKLEMNSRLRRKSGGRICQHRDPRVQCLNVKGAKPCS